MTSTKGNGNVTSTAPLMGATAAEFLSPTAPPKSEPDEAEIRTKLGETMRELEIKGELIYPPPKMDFTEFTFDAEHTQGDKHPHAVTGEETRKFIAEAYFAIVKYNGNSYNYYEQGIIPMTLEEAISIAEKERCSKVMGAGDCGDRWAFCFEDDKGKTAAIPLFESTVWRANISKPRKLLTKTTPIGS